MAIAIKEPRTQKSTLDRFLARCGGALQALYNETQPTLDVDPVQVYSQSVKQVNRMLAVLLAAEQMPSTRLPFEHVRSAALAIGDAASGVNFFRDYTCSVEFAFRSSGMGIFDPLPSLDFPEKAFTEAARALLRPMYDTSFDPLFFQTMPLWWLGCAYQYMLAFHPTESGRGLEINSSRRKGAGVYFTPPYLVNYIIECVLAPLMEHRSGSLDDNNDRLTSIKVLDPSMGGGDFLSLAVDYLCDSALFGRGDRAEKVRSDLAANCIYGVDVDPTAVDISRFCVWAASLYADGISELINSHMIQADALGTDTESDGRLDWPAAFPEVFDRPSPGFDAVVGNPPYIAAKNGLGRSSASGQSDSYLMFLSTVLNRSLVREDGLLSMVLPDPMLVRENATNIRRTLITDWTVDSILHISGAFSDALVANVIPVCRRTQPNRPTFSASRIERAGDRRSFLLRPCRTASELSHSVRRSAVLAQPRCEFLYLLEGGSFGEIIQRIHGDPPCLSNYEPPFVPLSKLNVEAIYRGEEVGKSRITSDTGELPILLGGQSIQSYGTRWEGRMADRNWVRKPLERYGRTKVLIQKSSPHIIAALDEVGDDHPGYIFPQSVYAVELKKPGMSEFYLLCLLNSEMMDEYIRRTVTGYKLLQPQLEIEDIRALPIRRISFTTPEFQREVDTNRCIVLFEEESHRASDAASFPELSNTITQLLMGTPEKSDVVHDLLVYLGRRMVDLTRSARFSPGSENTRQLETTRAAIETIVWRLYSSQPAQMELPW